MKIWHSQVSSSVKSENCVIYQTHSISFDISYFCHCVLSTVVALLSPRCAQSAKTLMKCHRKPLSYLTSFLTFSCCARAIASHNSWENASIKFRGWETSRRREKGEIHIQFNAIHFSFRVKERPPERPSCRTTSPPPAPASSVTFFPPNLRSPGRLSQSGVAFVPLFLQGAERVCEV